MTFLGFSGLVNFITCIFLGLFVLSRNPKNKLNISYFIFNFSIALYSFGYFFWQFAQNEQEGLFWFKVLTIGFIPLNVAYLHFVFYLTGIFDSKKKELIIYYLINIIFIILTINSYLYTKVELRHNLGYWPIPSVLFHIYLIFWFWQSLYGFYWLIKRIKTATGLKREQIKYFAIAVSVGFIGGASNWPMWYNIPFPPYLNILISLYAIMFANAIIKYQLLNIKVAMTRAGIFLAVYTIVLGIPLWIGSREGFGQISSISLFIMATTGPLVYRYLQKKADDLILAEQKKYQKLLNESGKTILKHHDMQILMDSVTEMIVKAVNIEFAAAFLLGKFKHTFRLQSAYGNNPFAKAYCISDKNKITARILDKKKPFPVEENDPVNSGINKPVNLVVPFFSDDNLYGFLFLGEKKNRSFYSQDDLNTFEILANQIALAVDNCLFMEQTKKAQEELFQSEKHSIIGGMAEGVAHQIKNRLNLFSVASSGIKMEINNFQKNNSALITGNQQLGEILNDLVEINETILKNVKKTDEVVHNIVEYSKIQDKENDFSEFSLKRTVDIAYYLTRIQHDFAVELKTDGIDRPVYGIMSRLLETIYSLMDNSLDAIEEKVKYKLDMREKKNYIPQISLKLEETDSSNIIQLFDNGVGIEDKNKNKIFAPYFTTKASYKTKPNTGIGMYVIHRIVEEIHSGKIWFESEYMKGTTFYIQLPKEKSIGLV